jgi:cytochrome c-type biogenesis protein
MNQEPEYSIDPVTSESIAKKRPFSKKSFFYIGCGFLGLLLTIVLPLVRPDLSEAFQNTFIHPIELLVSNMENGYQQWFKQQDTTNPVVLMLLAFLGGVLASISPCILGMLPINLSYIGTLKLKSRREAFVQAGLFVLGAVTVLSLLGLVSSFAGAVMVSWRGYINIGVGIIMAIMGLWLIGIINIPLPQTNIPLPKAAGAYGVGLTFALVSSPCASPVLFAVLAAAAASGSQVVATLTMVSYAVGYTILIFLASLFTGLAKQSKKLLQHSEVVVRLGSVALILTGIYYVVAGTRWFLGS